MVEMQTEVPVDGISGRQVTDFFVTCTDSDYRTWWEGTHLEFHTVERKTDVIGSVVYFDEYVGKHRLKFGGRITDYAPGKRLEYKLARGIPLPAWFAMECRDRPDGHGVDIIHTVRAGYEGIGRVLDPLIRLYLSVEFEEALNSHAHAEFTRLGYLLRRGRHAERT